MPPKKIVFVGNSRSGKTSIAYRLMPPTADYLAMGPSSVGKDGFLQPTIGVESRGFLAPSGQVYIIWDTAGLKKFEGLGPAYCIEAERVFIFAGGEDYRTLEQWRDHIVNYFSEIWPKVKAFPDIEFITGETLDEKEAMVRSLLL